MTDRELLELAAKAAGIEGEWHEGCGNALALVSNKPNGQIYWNPLADDGDALRLAVKLGLGLGLFNIGSEEARRRHCVWVHCRPGGGKSRLIDVIDKDPYATTRRAIVRAAAEIGRRMP